MHIASQSTSKFVRIGILGFLVFLLVACSLGGSTRSARTASTTPTTAASKQTPAQMAGQLTRFSLPPNSEPVSITRGPDGNLWFTNDGLIPARTPGGIGRITPKGKVTLFSSSTPEDTLGGIVSGPDGNLWFIGSTQIGRITPAGKITEFLSDPAVGPNAYLQGITVGPDGNLWFTFYIYDKGGWIGHITPSGTVVDFQLPLSSGYPSGITTGPDGNLWFTIDGMGTDGIGRFTRGGVFTEFPLSTSGNAVSDIISGPDDNLWFTDPNGHKIGRITPDGTVTEFALPRPGSTPMGITGGADGNLWFTELQIKSNGDITGNQTIGNEIGRITPGGIIAEFPLPNIYDSGPGEMTTGPDGNLWFIFGVYGGGDWIGRFTTGT